MTEDYIRELFLEWQHRLGLDLWTIEVRIEDPPDIPSALFQVRRSTTYNRAIVSVPPWTLKGGPVPEGLLPVKVTDDFIEEAVVHELLHCVRAQTSNLVMDRLEGLLHRDVYAVITESFREAEELEVENLAVALVEAWSG